MADRISHAHNTRILEFPFDIVREGVGGEVVSQSFGGIIAIRDYPFIVNILKAGWIDLEKIIRKNPHASFLRNWYGTANNYRDIEANASVPIVREEEWEKSPRRGMCFYGIVSYDGEATLSDLIKGDDLVPNGSTTLEVGDQKLVLGSPLKRMMFLYLSFPTWATGELPNSDLVRRIVSDSKSNPQYKSDAIFEEFPGSFNREIAA